MIFFFYIEERRSLQNEHSKKIGLHALFLAITLVVNALSAIGYVNGTTQSDVSDAYSTLITPSGFTFSIWSVIYGLLIISLIMMYVKRDDAYYRRVIDRITPLFITSSILNITWIIMFSFVLVELSAVAILAYAIVLALICKQLLALHDGHHHLLPLTFGLYTGWLMIATVVNVATSLVKIGWDDFGISDSIWAIIILAVATALVMYVTYDTQNAALPLPVA